MELSTCSRGQYFGELALIANKPRAASGFAVGDVTCAGDGNMCACIYCTCITASFVVIKLSLVYSDTFRSSLSLSLYTALLLFPFTPVLDVGAFERLLGPCMEVMKRNFSHYEEQLMQLFGTTLDITDTR